MSEYTDYLSAKPLGSRNGLNFGSTNNEIGYFDIDSTKYGLPPLSAAQSFTRSLETSSIPNITSKVPSGLSAVNTASYSSNGIANSMDSGYLNSNLNNLELPQLSPDETAMYNLQKPGNSINLNTVKSTNTTEDQGIDWGMQGYGGVALGAGQLGLGTLSFFENQKTAEAQRKLLGQQYTNNEIEMKHTAAARIAMSEGLGKYVPSSAPKLS